MVQRPKLKTYQAWTMSEALSFVKEDLGADAVILHTRTFDRGGFLGFGRRAVVEITAARAEDMPRRETPKVAGDAARAGGVGRGADAVRGSGNDAARGSNDAARGSNDAARGSNDAARGSNDAARGSNDAARGSNDAARNGIDAVRIGAAARAYAPTTQTAAARAPALDRANDVRDTAFGVSGGPRDARSDAARGGVVSSGVVSSSAVPNGAALDMDSEREKTRRLAHAMMIRLERESAERAAAAVNEQATLRAAERFGFRAREFQAPQQPSAPVFSTAQRFVLMPEPTVGASGAMRMTAALVRQPEPLPSIVDAFEDVAGDMTGEASDSSTNSAPESALRSAYESVAEAVAPSAAAIPAEPATTIAEAAPVAVPSATPLAADAPRTLGASDRAAVRRPIVVEPAPAPARSRELDEISDFVGRVLSGGQGPSAVIAPAHAAVPQSAAPARAPELESMYAQLIEQEVARELADRILREVEAELESDAMSPEAVRAAVERRIAALVPAIDGDAFRIVPGRHGPRRIAFVGPTGVGKTTTLAKIAAQLKLKRGLRVGIVAADTYRIAAVDQLRTYAEILGLPVEIASSPSDAARACADLADVDVILIDTAGRSQNDCMKISELRRFLASAQPDETHLVLSATAGMKTLEREAKAFGEVGVDRIVLTKLDEAAAFGTLVSLVERLGKQVSFLTHGQEVPDHIETARGTRLAALVLGSEVR